MSWNQLPPDIRQLAETHMTPSQLAAWQLELYGLGTRSIARELDISRGAVLDRLEAAHRTLRKLGITYINGTWTIRKDDAA